jgi:hypothetical protein
MKKVLSIVWGVLIACFGMNQLPGELIETKEIQTVLNHLDQDSIVFLNVTGTLYAPSNTLSNNQWREYFSDRVRLLISDPDLSQQLIDKIKNLIVQGIPKKNVDEITPQLIANLQDKKIVVLGITQKRMSTSYAENFGLITRNHLMNLGINLEKTLTYFAPAEIRNAKEYSFAYGILFTNKQPEGPAVISFLKRANLNPSLILMVDNSLASLESVQNALVSTGIKFKGVRYGAADAIKDHFDPTLGTIEFFAFMNDGRIMSDAEALEIKRSNSTINEEKRLDDYIRQAVYSLHKN